MKKLFIMTGVALSLSSAGYCKICPNSTDVASRINTFYSSLNNAQDVIEEVFPGSGISNMPRASIHVPPLTLAEVQKKTSTLCKYTAENGFSLSFYIASTKEKP